MEQIVKVFIGIFFIFAQVFVGLGITTAAIDASNAEDFVADAASIVEASDFSDAVMEKLEEEAKKFGYELFYDKTDLDLDGMTDLVALNLKYTYSIPFMNAVSKEHYAKAYAR